MSTAEVPGRFALHSAAVPASELQVVRFSCVEAVCQPFRLELSAACSRYGAEDIANRLIGQLAVFALHGPSGHQARRGVITAAAVEAGAQSEQALVRITLVPRLGLLRERVHSRIFQQQSTPEILRALFEQWRLDHTFQLAQSYAKRPYVTQYRETDFDFLTRLCAKEGFSFFLEQRPFSEEEASEPGEEKLVIIDHPSFQPVIASSGSSGSTLTHGAGRFAEREDQLSQFSLGQALAPELFRLGDFDFRHPGLALRAMRALTKAERSPIGEALGGEQLGIYLHSQRADQQGAATASEIDESIAKIRLEQARQQSQIGRGEGRCLRLTPGATFTLDGHPVSALNRDYVVTRIEHQGHTPEASPESPEEVYRNSFECVPAGVLCRAPYRPPVQQQSLETATVVGPAGEELHCDEYGRVKVQFHWDLEGSGDENSSCWLRVAQPWAGANWGAQFIPRIGTEVLVGFLGGDVDQPVVMGSLYNGAHPYPFLIPEEVTQSGFRSQSTPGGEGYSEIVIDDDKGRERLSVRAERDLEQVVENNYSLDVKHDEQIAIGGKSQRTVQGDSETTVLGERIESLSKSCALTVKGSHNLNVDGDAEQRVSGNHTTRVEGRAQSEHYGEALQTFHLDQVVRVLGHQVTVVGQHDARRSATLHVEGILQSSSTGTAELSSDKEVVFRVGETSLRLTPEGIELVGKQFRLHADDVQTEAKEKVAIFVEKQLALNAETIDGIAKEKLVLKGKQGALQLDDNGRLDGKMLKLNCRPDPVDEAAPPPYEPPKVTKIKLSDDDGKALPGRRYVIIASDGSERSGTLDENGEAELYLDEGGEIIFPDADNPRLG